MFSFSKGRCDGLAWSESIALLMEAEMGFLAGRREKRGLGMARVDGQGQRMRRPRAGDGEDGMVWWRAGVCSVAWMVATRFV
jgi:hypothetical protein